MRGGGGCRSEEKINALYADRGMDRWIDGGRIKVSVLKLQERYRAEKVVNIVEGAVRQ